MNKLTRMDLGLDVEAYKDYCNNLKIFAKYNKDYEILADDNNNTVEGTLHGLLQDAHNTMRGKHIDDALIDKIRLMASEKDRFAQMKNTIGKLYRDYKNPLNEKDFKIAEEFIADPQLFLDNDPGICIDLKRLYDKRKKQIADRKEMGQKHINTVTEKDIEAAGVSYREFDLIKKLMNLDAEIFLEKNMMVSSPSPYEYTVDLSKYDKTKIPQDCKEVLFRPKKMKKLHERYWRIASHLDW